MYVHKKNFGHLFVVLAITGLELHVVILIFNTQYQRHIRQNQPSSYHTENRNIKQTEEHA